MSRIKTKRHSELDLTCLLEAKSRRMSADFAVSELALLRKSLVDELARGSLHSLKYVTSAFGRYASVDAPRL